jgi:hypothetical protein
MRTGGYISRMTMHDKRIYWIAGMIFAGPAMAANPDPPARLHVKQVGNGYYKYTSKLKTVIELNFTLGFDHANGKQVLTQTLDKVATDYGVGGAKAFAIKKFTGPSNGSGSGLPNPIPTLADFLSGEVIVTNNISNLNNLNSSNGGNAAMAAAFETAVKTHGRGVVGFHGSGDGGRGWAFYSDSLHPAIFNSMGSQTIAPVYLNDSEGKHVVNDSILAAGDRLDVPMGTDSAGNEILKNVFIRPMKNEWYRFQRNLMTDPLTRDRFTCFMLYDPRPISTADLGAQYKFKGGNPYLWMVRIGAGKAVYFPAGHAADELTTGRGFDGGIGDLARMYAQLLFFTAGYDSVACGADCTGLPVVDKAYHLTGAICDAACATSVSLEFDKEFGFKSMSGQPYTARLVDVKGRLMATRSGKAMEYFRFDHSRLKPGLYLMTVKVGKAAPVTRRYLVSPKSS